MTSSAIHMCLIAKRCLTRGMVLISICYILSLAYTNTEHEEKYFVYATVSDNDIVQDPNEEEEVILNPILKNNSGVKVEEVSDRLDFPTSMAFLGPDDMLILEKNEGTVNRIVNGVLLEEPLLDVDVANDGERGMLGIAIAEEDTAVEEDGNKNNYITYVFLFFTESLSNDNDDDGKVLGNRLYRYELDQDKEKLVNPKLLLDLPATPGKTHNGGKVSIGP